MTENLLNKKVIISSIMGEVHGLSTEYKGTVTYIDDEFICLDDNTYVAKKYILSIIIK